MARDLNDTLIFVKVVEHGSFIAAARSLRLPKTSVSRKVQELEERLGAQLLHRTTRKLGLTEAGAIYFEHCQQIARQLDEAESAVGQLQGGPRGWLRVTAPYSIGITWVAPLLGEFYALHPELRVELVLTQEPLDLIAKELDVGLRVGNLPDSNLAARRLSVFRTQVYASPIYIERYGEPQHPDELARHRALAVHKSRTNGNYAWTLGDGNQVNDYRVDPILVANDPGPLISALLSGEGLMLASDVTIKPYAELGHVRRVLSGWTGPELDFNAVFPRGRVPSPKVRAFIDFLVDRLNFDADYMHVLCPDLCAQQQQRAETALAAALAAPAAASRPAARRKAEPEPALEDG
ncbi:DNA-binding transcriptional LysR family regulator [Dokdonella fugitiva]|uniref:DNA-binding transcriptional LysR family regulator n=1 Tax=Dokdonella fugitiva TaxID=328517 RepID=A0A839F8P3_9GAMM|nr:LysR family transcriptional regulator [Dokdonella fugitiva]MBA8889928.1 DNA-binding transcriptional LysR family regulator [Dokdonella fugitiva]